MAYLSTIIWLECMVGVWMGEVWREKRKANQLETHYHQVLPQLKEAVISRKRKLGQALYLCKKFTE